MSSSHCDDRHPEFGLRDVGQPVGLFPFLPQEGEGDVDALDLADPCLMLGAGAAASRSASI
jgi:hypothetical protein